MESKSEEMDTSNKTYKRQPKPPLSYITMIAMAIRDSPGQRATLNEIHRYLMRRFKFFQGSYRGWKDSVRHNLSCNSCFVKELKDPARPWGKGNYWRISETDQYIYHNGIVQKKKHKKSLRSEESASVIHPHVPNTLCSDSSMPSCFVPTHPHYDLPTLHSHHFGMSFKGNYLQENIELKGNEFSMTYKPFSGHSSPFLPQPTINFSHHYSTSNPSFDPHCRCFGASSQFDRRCCLHYQQKPIENPQQNYLALKCTQPSSSKSRDVESSGQTANTPSKFSSSFSIDSILSKDQ